MEKMRNKMSKVTPPLLTSNVKANVIRLQITIDDVIFVQSAEGGSHIESNMESLSQETLSLLSFQRQCLVKSSLVINLVLKCALETV
jgi:hypothetical protein